MPDTSGSGTQGNVKERNAPLNVDSFSIAIGGESIGLPFSRSLDTLLTTYLELVARLRAGGRGDVRTDDIMVLADATGVEPAVVENRLRRLVTA